MPDERSDVEPTDAEADDTDEAKADEARADEARADEALTYEEAREALADVVRRLEAGGGTLEESLALWERGERLAAVCQRWLDGARARLDAARAAASATPSS